MDGGDSVPPPLSLSLSSLSNQSSLRSGNLDDAASAVDDYPKTDSRNCPLSLSLPRSLSLYGLILFSFFFGIYIRWRSQYLMIISMWSIQICSLKKKILYFFSPNQHEMDSHAFPLDVSI